MRLSSAFVFLMSALDMVPQQQQGSLFAAASDSPTTSPTTSPTKNPTTSPTKNPTTSPTTSPTKNPTTSPTTSPTKNPTTSPTKNPTTSPTTSPTKNPTTSPTTSPTKNPTTSPTKNPTTSPTVSPTKNPTTSPTAGPSGQPSHQPSGQPSGIPSAAPSGQPSSIPSQQPSSIPSEAPSGQPSSIPSMQPSSQPSGQPTSQPSDQPSAQPSCTPSMSPTDPATTFLFYPDWSPGGVGCANDGNEPTYMSNNPSNYMFSTLEKCCQEYFSWNKAACSGALPGICARSLFYPDWEGENKGCIADGNEPVYMTNNAMSYMFSMLEDCCEEHYKWNYEECVGTFATIANGKYFPDWSGANKGCINGVPPQYMANSPELWMFDTLEECCTAHYNWSEAKDECLGKSTAANPAGTQTGVFYPDWRASSNTYCVEDGNQPAYMNNSPATYLFSSLKDCCTRHFNWNPDLDNCLAADSSGTSSSEVATNKYYMDYGAGKCVQDCKSGSGICGGLASKWEQLYDSVKDCCAAKKWWDDDCVKDSSS